jgi:hypothetical protein
MLIVADKGFAGREFAQLVTDYGASLKSSLGREARS